MQKYITLGANQSKALIAPIAKTRFVHCLHFFAILESGKHCSLSWFEVTTSEIVYRALVDWQKACQREFNAEFRQLIAFDRIRLHPANAMKHPRRLCFENDPILGLEVDIHITKYPGQMIEGIDTGELRYFDHKEMLGNPLELIPTDSALFANPLWKIVSNLQASIEQIKLDIQSVREKSLNQ